MPSSQNYLRSAEFESNGRRREGRGGGLSRTRLALGMSRSQPFERFVAFPGSLLLLQSWTKLTGHLASHRHAMTEPTGVTRCEPRATESALPGAPTLRRTPVALIPDFQSSRSARNPGNSGLPQLGRPGRAQLYCIFIQYRRAGSWGIANVPLAATCRRTPRASRPLPLRTEFSGRSTASTLRPPLGRWAGPRARRRTAMRW